MSRLKRKKSRSFQCESTGVAPKVPFQEAGMAPSAPLIIEVALSSLPQNKDCTLGLWSQIDVEFGFWVHPPISCIALDKLTILTFTNCKLNITIAIMRTARQRMRPQSDPQELHACVLWHSIILFVAVFSYIFSKYFLKLNM